MRHKQDGALCARCAKRVNVLNGGAFFCLSKSLAKTLEAIKIGE